MCISGSKKCSFFGKFGMLCFLETTILRLPFLPNYQRYQMFVAILATTLPIFCGTFPNRINEANYYKKLHFTILEKKLLQRQNVIAFHRQKAPICLCFYLQSTVIPCTCPIGYKILWDYMSYGTINKVNKCKSLIATNQITLLFTY